MHNFYDKQILYLYYLFLLMISRLCKNEQNRSVWLPNLPNVQQPMDTYTGIKVIFLYYFMI